jgi:DNA invertase Pin-like site-specific DNA recombinase
VSVAPLDLVAYLRVSTDKQAEQGCGLDVQADAIKQWSAEHGHRVVAWFRDEGVSGSNGLDMRLGLAEALDALRQGLGQGLIIYRLDRLARDLVIQEQLLADLRRIGVVAVTTSAAETALLEDDPDDPTRRLVRQVLGAVSEFERAMIALRMRSGRRRKHEHGGYAYGAPAFGYAAEARALAPIDQEQEAIVRIVELRARGLTLREIATALETEGIRTKRGGRWHPKVVRDILNRTTHTGATA